MYANQSATLSDTSIVSPVNVFKTAAKVGSIPRSIKSCGGVISSAFSIDTPLFDVRNMEIISVLEKPVAHPENPGGRKFPTDKQPLSYQNYYVQTKKYRKRLNHR